MTELKLFPGPLLERHKWVCDQGSDTGQWTWQDVTEQAHEFLYRDVEVAPDVTLADIFALVGSNPVLHAVYRQEFVDELCAEAAKGPAAPTDQPWERLEYLELYQVWTLDSATQEFEGAGRFHFHGVGVVQEADIVEDGHVMHKKNERIEWGVSLTPVRQLLHLPVRVRAQALVCEEDMDSCNYGKTIQKVINRQITLGRFIQATLWELSFHGGPGDSAAVREDLLEQVAEVKTGITESRAHDDIFESLGFPSRSSVYDQFFDGWSSASAHELDQALRGLADAQPVQQGLTEAFEDRVKVKPEFAALAAREFRKLVRLRLSKALKPTAN
ncbi:hypothetical protein BH10PSE16_BH10PSE16_26370 [soil metagenome]